MTLTRAVVDWGSYHATNCREYDFCGAFQGTVSEEDLERLLLAVDSSMQAGSEPQEPSSAHPEDKMETCEKLVVVESSTKAGSEPQEPSCAQHDDKMETGVKLHPVQNATVSPM